MNERIEAIIKGLEEKGEDGVRRSFIGLEYGHEGMIHSVVKEWLASKESERDEVKYKETLEIATKALRNSKWANIIAMIAMILSVLTGITIAVVQSIKH